MPLPSEARSPDIGRRPRFIGTSRRFASPDMLWWRARRVAVWQGAVVQQYGRAAVAAHEVIERAGKRDVARGYVQPRRVLGVQDDVLVACRREEVVVALGLGSVQGALIL